MQTRAVIVTYEGILGSIAIVREVNQLGQPRHDLTVMTGGAVLGHGLHAVTHIHMPEDIQHGAYGFVARMTIDAATRILLRTRHPRQHRIGGGEVHGQEHCTQNQTGPQESGNRARSH